MRELSHVSIVLVETEYPENIGSVARAMNTMGLKELILINPVPFKKLETYALAHKSESIVNNAQVHAHLDEALQSFSLVVGTTQRRRGRHYPLYTPREVASQILALGDERKVALVFGRESKGLTNRELRSCHLLSTIPTAVKQPAINLAQAVMVYCYELYQRLVEEEEIPVFNWDLADHSEIQYMYRHLESCLEAIRFHPRVDIGDFVDRFRRVLGRVRLERRDVKLFHKLFSEVERAVVHLGRDGRE